MGRNRFVKPDMVRLYLADVHRRHLEDLLDPLKQQALEPEKRATPSDLDTARAAIADAEADGAWIDVKRELNAGETRHVFAQLVKDMRAGEKIALDPEKVGITKVLEYLLGWSFTDDKGQSVAVSQGAIEALDQETYTEITQAIEAHEARMEADRTERKKKTTGIVTSEAISTSVA